jgi:hypothetical protein
VRDKDAVRLGERVRVGDTVAERVTKPIVCASRASSKITDRSKRIIHKKMREQQEPALKRVLTSQPSKEY